MNRRRWHQKASAYSEKTRSCSYDLTKINIRSSLLMNSQWRLEDIKPMVGQNKGTKGYIKHFESNFSMSFIVAISKDQLYGIIGAMQTTNSALFWRFLAEVINLHNKRFLENEKDLVLIMDNASIHKSWTTKEFINGHDLTILTTTPYWPWLNPVEKLILCIKNKIQKNQWNGR